MGNLQQEATEPLVRSRWVEQWVSVAGLFTGLAAVFTVAALNSLYVAEAFLDSEAVALATEKVARAVWWLVLTVMATGIASVLWARQRR